MTIDDLPLELRERICAFVEAAYQPSVYSFALASRQCLEAAQASLFKPIRISFMEAEQLDPLLERCDQVLERRNSFKHVRHLEVVVGKEMKPRVQTLALQDLNIRRLVEGTTWPTLVKYSSARTLEYVEALERMAGFVARLKGLSSFRHICTAPLPPSLLRQLNERKNCILEVAVAFPPYPGCCFADSGESESRQIMAHNALMLSSPCLRQIGLVPIHNSPVNTPGPTNFLHNVALLPLETTALDLYFTSATIKGTLEVTGAYNVSMSSSKKLVKHLRLMPFSNHERDLRCWDQILEFSCLETLQADMDTLGPELAWFVSVRPFTALKNLYINHGHLVLNRDNKVARFLVSLNPLRGLTLSGSRFEQALGPALEQHGDSLRELHLILKRDFYFDLNKSTMASLGLIRRKCPHLARFSITMQRTSGAGEEVSFYRAFGSHAGLQDVDITLQVDRPDIGPEENEHERQNDRGTSLVDLPNDASEETFWSQPWCGPGGSFGLSNGDVHDHLVSCAVDARLAESIFRCISDAKPRGAKPLSRLRLRVGGAGRMGQRDEIQSVSLVAEHLARSWLVIPHPNIDRVRELLATEIDPPEDNLLSKVHFKNAHRLPKAVAPIFRQIWPEDEKIGDWRKEWHSLPLAGSDS